MRQRRENPGKQRQQRRLDDRGTAMVTMIVVVLFVTILATTLLYISGMNLQIKRTAYNNKVSFYAGETTLEKIRADLMEDASYAATVAYNEVMCQYKTLGSEDARQAEFSKKFLEEFKSIMDSTGKTGGNWLPWMQSFQTSGAVLKLPSGDASGDGVYSYSEVVTVNDASGYATINNVEVTYTNANGFTSVITTDFYIQAPVIGWGVEMAETALGGVTVDDAVTQTPVKVSDYVQYANWQKL